MLGGLWQLVGAFGNGVLPDWARMLGALWQSVAACGGAWRPLATESCPLDQDAWRLVATCGSL